MQEGSKSVGGGCGPIYVREMMASIDRHVGNAPPRTRREDLRAAAHVALDAAMMVTFPEAIDGALAGGQRLTLRR